MTVPDVSLIVAVYNTMPYLTECLTSLVEQSIGLERMEIVVVDDGSTDGSGRELDRFAELYAETFKVIHQTNSGGPAAPSNRGLDHATGRYVYFVGADDHLGGAALERLVTAADEHDADIVVGKMVGVNGRFIHEKLFATSRQEVSLYDSALPWSLSNCKLFRRELIERHGLRFPEDMPVYSDQPFTIEACVRARRISVLGDYPYYYAVRRADASNITYRFDPAVRLACTEKLIRSTARLIEPGRKRDAVLRRHFAGELSKLLRNDFLDLDRAVQEDLCGGIAGLANEYLTTAIRDGLDVNRRIRLGLAQRHAVDSLCEVIRRELAGTIPPILIEGDRAFSRSPGFRDESLSLDDDYYKIADGLPGRIAKGLRTSGVLWETRDDGRPVLSITTRTPLVGPAVFDSGSVRVGIVPHQRRRDIPRARRVLQPPATMVEHVVRETTPAGAGTAIHARIPVGSLISASSSRGRVQTVCLYVDVAGETYEIPLPAAGSSPPRLRRWYRARPYHLTAKANRRGQLLIAVVPFGPTRAARLRLRRLINRSGEISS